MLEFGKEIKMSELVHVRKLGQGQFGMVYLVVRRNPKTGEQEEYAIKCINKGEV